MTDKNIIRTGIISKNGIEWKVGDVCRMKNIVCEIEYILKFGEFYHKGNEIYGFYFYSNLWTFSNNGSMIPFNSNYSNAHNYGSKTEQLKIIRRTEAPEE